MKNTLDSQLLPLLMAGMNRANDGFALTELHQTTPILCWVNLSIARLLGWPQSAVVGKSLFALAPFNQHPSRSNRAYQTLLAAGPLRLTLHGTRPDATAYTVRVDANLATPSEGSPTHALWIVRDLTTQKRYERALIQRARRDPLTGLPNRALAHKRLQQAIHAAKRGGGGVAVLYFDIDGFKAINDQLGHMAGDEVLRAIAQKVTGMVRHTDTVARLGGDEFAIILPGISSRAAAEQVASRLPGIIASSCATLPITASVGLAWYPLHGTEPEALLKHADLAMYRAKRRG